ncbi:DUF6644 family protein [Sphingomonas sp. MMS24-J13]|uniref:DUF6644 family protein n=1 Tax=Sphingomonas sp. MMS24-J13 TaxID=3238686 RepID=UPI00384F0391
MGQWLAASVAWIETLRLHNVMQTVDWAVPAVQCVHLLAIAAVFSSSLILAMRAAHVSGIDWSPARWGERLNAWVGIGLAILLVSGAVLIVGEPERSLLNAVFQAKMALLIVAVAVFLLLSHRLARLDPPDRATWVERSLAGLLVLLWLAIIGCGRWIAYA